MGSAALGMQAAGLGYSTVSAYNQAKTQQNVLGYDAKVAGNNAAIVGYQESVAKDVGAAKEQASELQTGNLYGAQRATMAANGIDLGQGNASDILTSTKYMGARDVATIQDNTNRTVWGLENQKQNYQAEQAATLSARSAINPGRAAVGTLLGGASQFASSWYNYNKDNLNAKPTASVWSGIKG